MVVAVHCWEILVQAKVGEVKLGRFLGRPGQIESTKHAGYSKQGHEVGIRSYRLVKISTQPCKRQGLRPAWDPNQGPRVGSFPYCR